jgi:hypothetical protein
VSTERVHFDKDDRVLVKVFAPSLRDDQVRKIAEAVRRWCDLPAERIFVYAAGQMEITVESN